MMQQGIDEGRPIRVGLLLLPQFSMMALASASEPLRAANRLASRKLYDWCLLSEEGGIITSSSGFETRTISISETPQLDRLFVVASLDIESKRPKPILQFLRKLAVSGMPIGALSTGTFILARAGLLTGKRCTLHWESLPQFAEEFPDIEVTRELYVRDGNRWTCAGGTAAIDLMLAQISGDHGAQLAADTAEQFLHTRIRGPEEQQRMAIQWRYDIHDARLAAAIGIMEQNLEYIVPINDIAKRSNLSGRQLERLWHQHFEMTPQRFYLNVRLNAARRLIKESSETIAAIALRCGFVSASHLGSAYRRLFGHSPSEERRKSMADIRFSSDQGLGSL
ncbi:GlxA family transcriptional regulator (plasmid) [Rhizobium sp. CB3060]|uniref:GlxA family transcriptional regulator n=1 Tax=Rhizobium sp. CB3060 TaxID=3138255 RepID=UPI0021A88618|nr:GlxA family transcriptional regulator [Rhizobium tropici]UWU23870.1 GlxA family transcriptional regulator [Rhizobium tropici]